MTFPNTAPFEVVVEVEAGEAIHTAGTWFTIGAIVKDLTDINPANRIIPPANLVPSSPVVGNMNTPSWPAFWPSNSCFKLSPLT